MNLLLDIQYALKRGKDFLDDKLNRRQFNDEELLYPFYVDVEPVTEIEFKEYLLLYLYMSVLNFHNLNAKCK